MDWLSVDVAAKIIIPLFTFFLGVGIVSITKRIERDRSERTEHLKAALKLVNDWYNQLHQLSVDAKLKPNDRETQRGITFYIQNRLILPELLLHLEYFRQKPKYQAHAKALEDFLVLVTSFRSENIDQPVHCQQMFSAVNDEQFAYYWKLDDLLPELDARLQAITRLTGRALAA